MNRREYLCYPAKRRDAGRIVFSGGRIAASQRNGPYRLTDVYVTTAGGSATTAYFYDVHTTPPWPYTQFDATPIAFRNVQQQVGDSNGNGLYDHLAIKATVAAIGREGDYTWTGRLVAPDGSELGITSGAGQPAPRKAAPGRRRNGKAGPERYVISRMRIREFRSNVGISNVGDAHRRQNI